MSDHALTTPRLVRRLSAAQLLAVASAARSPLRNAASSFQAAPSGAAPG